MDNLKIQTNKISKKQITNNVQRVAQVLLRAEGKWVPRSKLGHVPSSAARIRDLRKASFGGFEVECKTSTSLGRNTKEKTYYYRIAPESVQAEKFAKLFKLI